MKIKVKIPGMQEQEVIINENMKALDVLNMVENNAPYPLYGCMLNNAYRSLNHIITHDCTLEFLDIRNQAMWLVYQNSLVLLYLKAVHDVFGKNTLVSIYNSLSKGLFTIVKDCYDKNAVEVIEKRMWELVEEDKPIVKKHYSRNEALSLAKKLKENEIIGLIKSNPTLDDIEICSLDDETDIFYTFLVPSTGYLKYFDLKQYKNGIIIRYPHQSDPLTIPEFEAQPLLFNAFKTANKWSDITGVKFVEDLNNKIENKQMSDLYLLQEALHEKEISDIADQIAKDKKRIVLICGPSSSGKTTFARRLCIQLAVLGITPLYLGTDDYFVNREETPLDENGEKDYESIRSIDISLFISNLQDLLNGKEVDIPRYDFIKGEKVFGERITKIKHNQVIVIEGIHALNEILTNGIDDEEKFKIYISPFTPIAIDHHNRIPTTDCRLLRRIVRDYRTRGRSVQTTIKDWSKVRAGEEVNIFPYNSEADVFFNSNCIYELSVLKKYLLPLLKSVEREDETYGEAARLLGFLKFFDEASDDELITNNSIIREFIGGSIIA